MVGGNCADVRIGGGQRLAICRFQPAGLDLRDRFALVALDEHQIARGKPRKDVGSGTTAKSKDGDQSDEKKDEQRKKFRG